MKEGGRKEGLWWGLIKDNLDLAIEDGRPSAFRNPLSPSLPPSISLSLFPSGSHFIIKGVASFSSWAKLSGFRGDDWRLDSCVLDSLCNREANEAITQQVLLTLTEHMFSDLLS